jgi:protein O-mannosyl-transferase
MSAARSTRPGNRTPAKSIPRAGRGLGPVSAGLPPPGSTIPCAAPVFAWWTLWIGLALIAVNLAVYAPVRQYEFVSIDDPAYVSENPHISGGVTWPGIAWAFSSGYAANWHPLTWLSHMLDVHVFGMNAGRHHLINLALHIANTLLLFGLLLRLTGALGRSAFVAGLFAVHPLHVESVAWIAERKDVLSTLFWLLTLWAYAAYVRRPGVRRYLLVLVGFALGLMTKPMLVTLPFVMLLLDVWPLGRVAFGAEAAGRTRPAARGNAGSIWLQLVWEKLPLFALAAISSLVTWLVQQLGGAVTGFELFPWTLRVENALMSYAAYIGKMLWPARLVVLVPYPRSIPGWLAVGAFLVLLGISVAVIRGARRHPYLLVGWYWYLGTLVPVIGIVQAGIQARADRYTYVPLIGLFIMAAWGAADLLARRPQWRRALPVTAVLVILAFMMTARGQVRVWQSSVALWEHAVELTLDMDNYGAHNALGMILRQKGRAGEAIAHFTAAVALNPDLAEAHQNLGRILVDQGRMAEAVPALSQAVRLMPDNAEAQSELGAALSSQGRIGEAIAHYTEALRIKPDLPQVHNALGYALTGENKISEALAHFSEAVRLKPDFAEAHNNMGLALAGQGKLSEALMHFSEAVRLKPGYAEAHNNIGLALAGQAKFAEAIDQYQEALRLKPDYAEAHNNLGLVLANQGKFNEAIFHFSEAVRLKPGSEIVHVSLGMALASAGRVDEAIRQLTEALRINPTNPTARSTLDYLLRRSKKSNE